MRGDNETSARDLIEEMLSLQRAYARTFRYTVTSERLEHAPDAFEPEAEIAVQEYRFREPLLEHVGHLPVLAAFLHGRIECGDAVNLERVLAMLAVHDIGETVIGDELAYRKGRNAEVAEREAARTLLNNEQRRYHEEFEALETLEAKFAKAVDALAPFLHELDVPEQVQGRRFRVYEFGVVDIEAKKAALFEWDPVLSDIFRVCMDAFRRIERGESTGFAIDAASVDSSKT